MRQPSSNKTEQEAAKRHRMSCVTIKAQQLVQLWVQLKSMGPIRPPEILTGPHPLAGPLPELASPLESVFPMSRYGDWSNRL
jgi:hypothetical protein